MKNITVIGVGYVGLVTGACFADLGNRVVALDINEMRIENLKRGIMPIYEPGLKEIVERNVKAERLSFTTDYLEALHDAEFVFICVGTPEGVDGEADLKYVRMAAESIAKVMDHEMIIVNKSTVPVGTGDWVANIIREHQPRPIPFAVVSCPEFLREGSAVRDFFNPDRTVLGSMDREAANKVAQLHLPLRAPIVITDLRTAEMIKYASNAFLATRISFINEIANICEALGADVKEVVQGMGYDKRIGHHFLEPGVGYGGSCFPKDVKALAYMAQVHGTNPELLHAVMGINQMQRKQIVIKLQDLLGDLSGKIIALLGLAFKENTDDIRVSPALEIAEMLHDLGAIVRGYDPAAMAHVARAYPFVQLAADPYDLAQGCDAVVVATPWNEFKALDMERIGAAMRQKVIVDGRNLYDPERLKALGFIYRGVGRGYNGALNSHNG
ncbi:MAG: UDP-glucose 6-dehydrogenase [Candidatus Thermofonsia Clade 1 bacterium]|jgi:UDPglucose 6-dehydrogenase|uniref:UDP-glucose 6-dehydrogenase n=1 Tax=Candidatus Thermofonsia Clade 1 bacterium TaxID=2364210 RepID=A0A2M8PI81_9CHLR|nr:MAG: UDP-glucose 6-dehydrogenase [Candidatus Thermofonsia Clade 1 bacterium]PJF42297.1 MAG: UDP-glucose 6-dehydrogenase [Candidatus Thermofonsia Clade 1 bacterium]